jgi:hypothetical protein
MGVARRGGLQCSRRAKDQEKLSHVQLSRSAGALRRWASSLQSSCHPSFFPSSALVAFSQSSSGRSLCPNHHGNPVKTVGRVVRYPQSSHFGEVYWCTATVPSATRRKSFAFTKTQS